MQSLFKSEVPIYVIVAELDTNATNLRTSLRHQAQREAKESNTKSIFDTFLTVNELTDLLITSVN